MAIAGAASHLHYIEKWVDKTQKTHGRSMKTSELFGSGFGEVEKILKSPQFYQRVARFAMYTVPIAGLVSLYHAPTKSNEERKRQKWELLTTAAFLSLPPYGCVAKAEFCCDTHSYHLDRTYM